MSPVPATASEAQPGRRGAGLVVPRRAVASLGDTLDRAVLAQHLAIRAGWAPEPFRDPMTAPPAQFPHVSPPYVASTPGKFEVRLAYVAGTIENSLFEDGQAAGLSVPLILKLAEMFGWDIDFALDLRDGDSFVAFYEEKYWLGRKISDGAILAAEFTNRGRTYRAIGFRGADGRVSYFTPGGNNLQRAFLRTPVPFSSVSSSFSPARYHPILKTWRAHNGVDYAAPVGTSVRATARGRVLSIGWNGGGYGNTVVIKHGGIYSTLYAHLSGYRAGLQAGQSIEQGEVIGYVGQTGLATGPHLHYEFQVHGQHQNPLRLGRVEGDAIAPTLREEFLGAARTWVTRLDFIGGRHLAAR